MSATTETVQQELPPYLAAAYRDAAERALKLSQDPYEAYQGRLVAPLSPHTQQALDLSGHIESHAPYLARAHHHAQRGSRHFPHHYQEQMQPYQEAVVNNLAGLGQSNFSQGFLPELEKRFAGSGPNAFHPGFSTEARRDIEGEIKSQQEDSLSRGYQHALQGFELERARELEAARLLKDTGIIQQASHLEDIKSLREAGMIAQAQEQALLDQAHEEWKEGKRHPYEKLMEYFGILRGTPYVPSSYVKREISRPSDIYHHGDWRNIAENVGLNALGGILAGNEPSPAIVAAFKNILPGGEERKNRAEMHHREPSQKIQEKQRALAEQKLSEEKRQEEREQLKQADIERLYNADIQNFIHHDNMNKAQGGYFTQATYDLAQQQSLQRARQQADQLDAQREAQYKASQESDRKAEQDRLSRESKREQEFSKIPKFRGKKGEGGDKPQQRKPEPNNQNLRPKKEGGDNFNSYVDMMQQKLAGRDTKISMEELTRRLNRNKPVPSEIETGIPTTIKIDDVRHEGAAMKFKDNLWIPYNLLKADLDPRDRYIKSGPWVRMLPRED